MSSLTWCRLYHELKDDPKVGALTDPQFRVFIESLCWATEKGNGGGTGLTLKDANWAFRRNVTETLQQLFVTKLLGERPTGEIYVTNWKKRQKKSDSSAERVRRFRENKGKMEKISDVTLQTPLPKRDGNALEESRVENNNNPLNPPEGGKEKGPLQLRAEKLFKRGVKTPLTAPEERAFKKSKASIIATSEEDWILLERFYAAPQPETFARKDLATLVNNWNGEIDRARKWAVENPAVNGHGSKNLDEWPVNRRYNLDNPPLKEHFPSQQAFESHNQLYQQWRTKRLAEKQPKQ